MKSGILYDHIKASLSYTAHLLAIPLVDTFPRLIVEYERSDDMVLIVSPYDYLIHATYVVLGCYHRLFGWY